MWTAQKPGLVLPLDAAAAEDAGVVWLSLLREPTLARDLIGGQNVTLPGGWGPDTEGSSATFNGSSQAANLALALPPGISLDNLVIAARVKATAAQAASPGCAFGLANSSSTQTGIGVGFDTSNNVGAAWLGGSGAGLTAYSSGALNTWYTVFVQALPSLGSNIPYKAWINGAPAATNQGGSGSGAVSAPNEIALGAQHRSSGFLRWFHGNVEWAALLNICGPAGQFSLTDALAAQLYAENFPYNLLRQRKAWLWKGSAAPANTASGSSTQGTPVSTASGSEAFTGSGASSQGGPSSSGAASENFATTGAAQTQGVSSSTGSGTEGFSGSGTSTQASPSAGGSGVEGFSASGASTQAGPSTAGTAAQVFTGSGAATQAAASGSATGAEGFTGSGTSPQASPTSTGTGGTGNAGSGASAQASPTTAGSGGEAFSGSGAGTQAAPIITAAATEAFSGTAASVQAAPSSSGSAEVVNAGTGSATQGTSAAAGQGTEAFAGSGAATQPAATSTGAGGGAIPWTVPDVLIKVSAEKRVLAVAAESRILAIPPEIRILRAA